MKQKWVEGEGLQPMTTDKALEQEAAEKYPLMQHSLEYESTERFNERQKSRREGWIAAMKEVAGRTASSNEWISVEEISPQDSKPIALRNDKWGVGAGFLGVDGFYVFQKYQEAIRINEQPTHWQPLPTQPTQPATSTGWKARAEKSLAPSPIAASSTISLFEKAVKEVNQSEPVARSSEGQGEEKPVAGLAELRRKIYNQQQRIAELESQLSEGTAKGGEEDWRIKSLQELLAHKTAVGEAMDRRIAELEEQLKGGQDAKAIADAFDKGYLRGVAECEEKNFGSPIPEGVLNRSEYLSQFSSPSSPVKENI